MSTPSVISRNEVYTVPEFRKRAGLGDFSFRKVRRDGLRIVAVGKKRYVRGSDWLDYIDRKAEEVETTETGSAVSPAYK